MDGASAIVTPAILASAQLAPHVLERLIRRCIGTAWRADTALRLMLLGTGAKLLACPAPTALAETGSREPVECLRGTQLTPGGYFLAAAGLSFGSM